MTNKELYLKFNSLNTKDHVKLLISHRYSCDFIDCSDGTGTYFYFTESFTEKNSNAQMSYADLKVYDIIENKQYYGRLYRIVCDDLADENKYSYMIYLTEMQFMQIAINHKEYNNWLSSIFISADNIKIISTENDTIV